MRVDLKIRGPFPAREDLLIIQIAEGTLTGVGVFEDKLSGIVIAPSGDALEVGPNNIFKRSVPPLKWTTTVFLHAIWRENAAK